MKAITERPGGGIFGVALLVAGAVACGGAGQGASDGETRVDALGVAAEAFPGERGEVRTGSLTIAGEERTATYEVLHNQILVEGDMIVGPADPSIAEDDVPLESADLPDDLAGDAPPATAEGSAATEIATSANATYWPKATVYFTIDPRLPNKARVWNAIRHYKAHTHLHFVKRTTQPNFVTFTGGTGCSSYVGMIGKRQYVHLAPGCSTASAIHEIGHTVGLEHEQSRLDRDTYVVIHWENIDPAFRDQFAKDRTIKNLSAYDVHSVMHYPWWAFSRNGRATITTRDGHRAPDNTGLSARDVSGLAELYP